MGSYKNHTLMYMNLKKDAENRSLSVPSRVELYFLSIFHLIESCMSKVNIHINKHQKVRYILEGAPEIFGVDTEKVWRLFQELETRLRPKFTYGFSWEDKDFEDVKRIFIELEAICVGVLENEI
ncbi:MAG: hypothetical protein GF353_15890 [Candidatus Lokiarchaeota archaeon]|nr:hypothetical protein [Candidatus Lokiarchaeota archaeon]